jgi:hypothetical protein
LRDRHLKLSQNEFALKSEARCFFSRQ